MEKYNRFRMHISFVAEEMLGHVLSMIAGIFILVYLWDELCTEDVEDIEIFFIIVGVILLSALLLFILKIFWKLRIWSRTWFSVSDNIIKMERKTIIRKQKTMSISHISNINVEQNLFERIMGTSCLKLNTDSLSTADETDMQIILKKEETEELYQYILSRIQQAVYKSEANENDTYKDNADKDYTDKDYAGQKPAVDMIKNSITDLICHGLFSSSPLSVLALILTLEEALDTIKEILNGNMGESFIDLLFGGGIVLFIFLGALWNIVDGFIRYYGFQVTRSEERVHIKYGFFKNVEYTVPVNRIHGVKFHQSMLARLTGRYMVEIINVGIDDEEAEEGSFLLLYEKKDKIKEQISMLLPEFADGLEEHITKQPSSVWIAKLPGMLGYVSFVTVCVLAVKEIFPQVSSWTLPVEMGLVFLYLLFHIGDYFTSGFFAGNEYLILSIGYLGRDLVMLQYDKIQYLEIHQNFLAKRCGIQDGTVYLLAGTSDNMQKIPYFQDEEAERVKTKILNRSN